MQTLKAEWAEKLLVFLHNCVLNEADTFKTCSILIYLSTEQSIYTEIKWKDALLINTKLKAEIESLISMK